MYEYNSVKKTINRFRVLRKRITPKLFAKDPLSNNIPANTEMTLSVSIYLSSITSHSRCRFQLTYTVNALDYDVYLQRSKVENHLTEGWNRGERFVRTYVSDVISRL